MTSSWVVYLKEETRANVSYLQVVGLDVEMMPISISFSPVAQLDDDNRLGNCLWNTRLCIHHSVRENATRSQYQISNLYTSHFVNGIAGYQYKTRLFTTTKNPHEIIVNYLWLSQNYFRGGGEGTKGPVGMASPKV